MRLTYLQYSLIVFSLAFTLCKPGHTQDGAIDSPQNVRIEGNLLAWNPVGNASGYNIYYNPEEAAADSLNDRPVYYQDTLKGVTKVTTAGQVST